MLPQRIKDMNKDKIKERDKLVQPSAAASSRNLKAMNTNLLQTLASKSPLSSVPIPLKSSAATTQTQNLLLNRYHAPSIRISPVNSTSGSSSSSSNTGGNSAPEPVPPPITPPDTLEIRFRRRSRRQKQKREESVRDKQPMNMPASANTTPKNWEDMSLTEKAVDLYMGEKGLLFWLNKFAYASIFIMIGAWIMFRFVGPSLNLYQLDSAPLSPSSIFKGS